MKLEEYGNVTISIDEDEYIPTYTVSEIPREPPFYALRPLIEDDSLEEVVYNGPEKVVKVYHRRFGICNTNIMIPESEAMDILTEITTFVGKKLDARHPLFDGRLPDGSRVNATLPPASPDGPTITIRKFLKDPLTIVDLIKNDTINAHVGAYLWTWVEGIRLKPANIILGGGTSSGKTSTLNVLAMFIPTEDRLLTIEDAAELQLEHEHWVRLETVPALPDSPGITMDDLLKNSLRMRPDRIIIGEIRGPEAKTLFTAMNTGHDGVMGTVHANTASETVVRLTTSPMTVDPVMLNALDLIVMHQRMTIKGYGTVRKITEISEIAGFEKDKPRLNTIFRWDPVRNTLVETGVPSKVRENIAKAASISLTEFDELLMERESIIEGLVEQNYRDVVTVTGVIQNYYVRKAKDAEEEEEQVAEEMKKKHFM